MKTPERQTKIIATIGPATESEEMLESLEEFGISSISSLDTKGQVMYYAVSSTKELMERMCTEVSLDGSIIEFTSIYDQKIED